VFIAGQGLGLFIYARNLMLIRQRRDAVRRRHPDFPAGQEAGERDLTRLPRGD